MENSFQKIIDALPDQIAIINQDGFIKYKNIAWDLFTLENGGLAETSGIGVNYLDVLEKGNNTYEVNGIRQVMQQNIEEFSLEYPCPSPTEERWYCMHVKSLADNLIMIRHENVTEIVTQHSAVEDVLESMTDAFFSLNSNWEFSFLNTAGYSLLGREFGTLIGKNIWLEFPEAKEDISYTKYHETMEKRETTIFETYYPPLNTWFEAHAYPQKDGGISVYFKDIGDKKKTEERLKLFAYYDELTNLPNRRSIIETVSERIALDLPCTLLFIDLDGFKNVNDIYGHEKGDQLLQQVGLKLSRHLRNESIVGRLGGDEFLVLTFETNPDYLKDYVHYVLSAFHQPFITSHSSFSLTASIGIASYPHDARDANLLMSAADTAMYQAKRTRGNSYSFYHSDMKELISRRLLIEQELGEDLRKHGIYFVVQPQINIETNSLVGLEVLSRWSHPSLGQISPLEFISIAEDSGNILKLTQYLLAEIFARVSKWIKIYQFDKKISINITPYLLSQKSFFDDLFDLLDRYHIPPSMIELEITEETELVTSEMTLFNINECRKQGITIAIDDFGTGFSMLSYLTYFPVDCIKIDRFFIKGIGHDHRSEAILESIIHLATSLKCEIIAEGVEEEQQLLFLKEHGCPVIQGFITDRPLDLDEFEDKYVITRKNYNPS